jgi:hypothetical protein
VLTAAALVAGTGVVGATLAHAQVARVPETQTVRVIRGAITGIVSDERGGPLPGATVSALGRMWATAVTDDRGSFSIDSLPAGEYVIQAHLPGFAGSRRETVRVASGSSATQRLLLRRLESPVATTGAATPVYARPIMAAGFALPSTTLSDKPESADGERPDHPHDEIAWRIRHQKRTILKDSSAMASLFDEDDDIGGGSIFGRAVDSAASLAATFFTELPFSGEVNVLTTSVFGPGDLFAGELVPRGVAYLAIGAPTPAGNWSLKAAMSQGDLSSWVIAGAFTSRDQGANRYEFGYTYATQEYIGGNPSALVGVKDGSRNVGEVFAYDRWSLSPRIAIEYGGR